MSVSIISDVTNDIGNNSVERVVIYRAQIPDAQQSDPGVPDIGSELGGLIVREKERTIVQEGVSDFRVRAVSPIASGMVNRTPVDIAEPGRTRWTSRTINIISSIPSASTNRIVTGRYGDDNYIERFTWVSRLEQVTDDGLTFDYQTTVSDVSFTQIKGIQEQANNIHTIGEITLKLIGAQVDEVAKNSLVITYSWLADPGTRQVVGSVLPGEELPDAPNYSQEGQLLVFPNAGMEIVNAIGATPPAGGLMRMPFHKFGFVDSPGPVDDTVLRPEPPSVFHYLVGTPDPDGWKTLPGLENLL